VILPFTESSWFFEKRKEREKSRRKAKFEHHYCNNS
jgi:hypothetical protein